MSMKRIVDPGAAAGRPSRLGVMYKWVDQDGKVHYSDQPPPAGAKKQP